MLKILALCPPAWDGCTWYRIRNFKDEASRQGTAQVEFIDPMLETDKLARVISNSDILFCRLNETLPVIFDEFNIERLGKPIVLDLDDAFDDINPLSDSYQTGGLQEVKLQDGTYLWKDGEKGFSLKENWDRYEAYKRLTRLATAVIVTSFELKNYVEQYNKNVVIVPNCINFDLFPVLPLRKENTTTITWSGGSSHYADLMSIQPQLNKVMQQNPRVRYTHVGQAFQGIIKDLPQQRVSVSDWVTADGHGYRLACLNADIGIAPLINSSFNKYKSSIKFYEYSALKIPTLAKRMTPYTDDIIEGKTGLLYDTPEEFREKLEWLIEHPLDRVLMAEEAYKYVKNNRDVKEITKDWVFFLEKLSNLVKQNYDTATL